MARLWRMASLGAAVLGAAAGCSPTAFERQGAAQCGDGQCFDGYCAFDDASCPSGFSYGEHAPSDLAKSCVPSTDDTAAASSSAAGTSPDPSTSAIGTTTETSGDPQLVTAESSATSVDATSTGDTPEPTTTGSESTGPAFGRVTDGLIALYRFEGNDDDDDVVDDLSGVEPLLPLTVVADGGSPSWGADGLVFADAGVAMAMGSSSKIRQRLQATTEFTLEVWATPAELVQVGPPRLVTLSLSGTVRSVTLMHGGIDPPDGVGLPFGDQYGLRLVTSDFPALNGTPTILTESIAALQPTHVVATRDAEGLATIWVDGEPRVTEVRTGDFSAWPEDHILAVGNEPNGTRGYVGTIHLVAIYERPLSADEIETNMGAGY